MRAVLRHIHRIDDYQRQLLLRGLGVGFATRAPAKSAGSPVTCGFKVECDIAKRLEECSTRPSVAVFTLDPHVRDMVYDACGRFKSASELRNRDFAGALALRPP